MANTIFVVIRPTACCAIAGTRAATTSLSTEDTLALRLIVAFGAVLADSCWSTIRTTRRAVFTNMTGSINNTEVVARIASSAESRTGAVEAIRRACITNVGIEIIPSMTDSAYSCPSGAVEAHCRTFLTLLWAVQIVLIGAGCTCGHIVIEIAVGAYSATDKALR